MFCKQCGKELKEEEQFCSSCGTPVNSEKTSTVKANVRSKKSIMIAIICVVVLTTIIGVIKKNTATVETGTSDSGLFGLGQKDDKGFEQASANASANGTNSVSFKNMRADDEGLNEVQKDIINYFDNDYFSNFNVETSQRYPQIFEGAKITDTIAVLKIIKSDNDGFKILVNQADGGEAMENPYAETPMNEIPETAMYIIEGKQLDERLIQGDIATIYGRYQNVSTVEIDGKTYTLPTISIIDIQPYKLDNTGNLPEDGYRYSYSTIKNVAEYIFGKDIKLTSPDIATYFDDIYNNKVNLNNVKNYLWELEFYMPWYLVTLDNQSNANFKSFDFFKDEGMILYNQKYNDLLFGNVIKQLFVSADFQHYIVTTYDSNLKHVYIDYFDRDLKKLWNREFDYNSNDENNYSPLDYTATQMAIVIDNDLYLIDLKTGENIIEPVLVGNKTKVIMMSDGIVLVGTENKDTIMKVGYDGKILYRIDGDTKIENFSIVITQIVNGKLVVYLCGTKNESEITKYLVINNDGTVEYSTKDV